MKLINADNLVRTVGYYRLRNGEDIQIRYVAIEQIDSAPTVKAIPVEWIRKWNIDNYPYTALLMSEIIPKMIADWEKENEVNRR